MFSVECSISKDVETERENQFYYKIYAIFDGDMIETMSRFSSLICYNLISGGSSMSQTRGRQAQVLGRQPIITGRNEVVANVMFLQLCVILFTWGRGVCQGDVVFCWVLFLHTLNQIDNRLLEVPLQELVSFIEITTYSTYQS